MAKKNDSGSPRVRRGGKGSRLTTPALSPLWPGRSPETRDPKTQPWERKDERSPGRATATATTSRCAPAAGRGALAVWALGSAHALQRGFEGRRASGACKSALQDCRPQRHAREPAPSQPGCLQCVPFVSSSWGLWPPNLPGWSFSAWRRVKASLRSFLKCPSWPAEQTMGFPAGGLRFQISQGILGCRRGEHLA